MPLSDTGKYAKPEVDAVIGRWGIAAILEVVADRLRSDSQEARKEDDNARAANYLGCSNLLLAMLNKVE